MTTSIITIECPECEGDGEVSRYQSFYSDAAGMSADFYDELCERCGGSGEVAPDVTAAAEMTTVVNGHRRSRA